MNTNTNTITPCCSMFKTFLKGVMFVLAGFAIYFVGSFGYAIWYVFNHTQV